MTQSEVADALHITYQAVSKWERDESLPDITMLPNIAELFQISIDTLSSNSYETKTEEIVDADQAMGKDDKNGINHQITEIGMKAGRIPNAEELAEKISDFFTSRS